jgi:hypothetical protein
VSAKSSQPLDERVTNIQDCHPPKSASQLHRFLGMVNFYKLFLPHAAATQAPLHNILSGPTVKGSHPITWTPELLKTFDECKASVSRATLVAHPDPSAPLALVIDASTSTTGAVLQQLVNNAWQALAFFSKNSTLPSRSTEHMTKSYCHLRSRKTFPPHAGSAPLHHLHRSQASHICLPAKVG